MANNLNRGNNTISATSITAIQITPEQAAENIKIVARRIRGDSARIRDIVKILHRSGALGELAVAVQEAAIATRDTSREINETAKELKQHGIEKETATAVNEATKAAKDTKKVTVMDAAQKVKGSATTQAAETSKQVTRRTRKTVSRRKKRQEV